MGLIGTAHKHEDKKQSHINMSNEAYKEWPFSLREVHLIGGIRAYNHGNNKVEIHPATTNAKNAIIKINKYENLYSDLEKFGLPVVGCDFLQREMKLTEYIPHNGGQTAKPVTDG